MSFALLHAVWRGFHSRVKLLIPGLLVVALGFALTGAAFDTGKTTVNQDLSAQWRPTYDILVRPQSGQTDWLATGEENGESLLEPNYLSGARGGIIREQYEQIKALLEVAVAAPIAVVGYFPLEVNLVAPFTETLASPSPLRLYRVTSHVAVDAGWRSFEGVGVQDIVQARQGKLSFQNGQGYVYVDPLGRAHDFSKLTSFGQTRTGRREQVWTPVQLNESNTAIYPNTYYRLNLLLAGIDPAQEAALVDLKGAIEQGRYLTDEDASYKLKSKLPGFPSWTAVPVLINTREFTAVSARFVISALNPPPADDTAVALAEQGPAYLETLPETQLDVITVDASGQAYRRVIDFLRSSADDKLPVTAKQASSADYILPAPLVYQAGSALPGAGVPLLQIQLKGHVSEGPIPSIRMEPPEPAFRDRAYSNFARDRYYQFYPVGYYDLGNLAQSDLNALPVETYAPPLARLRYDLAGNPVTPVDLRPTHNPDGYLTAPPFMLTTLDGAAFFSEDPAYISAIRIRVQGVEAIGEAAQQRIEAVAARVEALTGLQADITLGSSPQAVLAQVPEVGYVEEHWVKQLVAISILRGFNQADALLFGSLFLVSMVYIFSLSVNANLSRVKEFGLLQALGWRRQHLVTLMLGESVLLACATLAISAGLAVLVIRAAQLDVPVQRLLLLLPGGLALFLVGSAVPILQAVRRSSILAIQEGEFARRPARASEGYALRSLLRRPLRTALILLSLLIAVGLLGVLLLVQFQLSGVLAGTFLGEYLSIKIEAYHWAVAAVSVALVGFTVLEMTRISIYERRREIGLLLALGWRVRDVLAIFMRENLLLGLVGGVAGAMVAALAFRLFQPNASARAIGPLSVVALLAVLVCVLAALPPVRQIARMRPADSLR